jgi:outer membrane protein, multidrug efflux system
VTRVTLAASYEIDFWGRFRRASEAARAELLAQEGFREALLLSLTAEVVRRYFALVSLDAQRALTQRTLESRDATVRLEDDRLRAGVISELELRRATAEREAVRSQLAAIELAAEREEAALAVVLGRSPRAVIELPRTDVVSWDAASVTKRPPAAVPSALPSELLERRPDLRAAEQRLVAANARIGAVKAAYFPRIGLTGLLGSESASLADLFSGPAGIWRLAAGATAPLFTGGRREGEIAAATALQREALAGYERSVQQAFADVRAALAGQTAAMKTFDAESERAGSLVEALALARARYTNGVASQLDVLDAERNLFAAERARIDALASQHAAIAEVALALGGGW